MAERRSILGRAIRRSVRGTVLTIAAIGFGAYAISYLARMPAPGPDKRAAPGGESAAAPALTVVLDAEGQRKGGIETAPIKPVTYQREARAFGTVLALDRMTTLYDDALTAAAQLKSSQAKVAAARAANERAQKLLKVFPTAAAQAEAAEEDYKVDAAGLEATQAQIDALRNTALQEWGPVLGGMLVQRADLADRLIRGESVLIQLALMPGLAAKPPRRVALALPDRASTAADYISPATSVDPKIQNAAFFYVAPAAPDLLPGMDLLALVAIGEREPGLAVPAPAIVWQGGRAWVYLRVDQQTFERRPLEKDAIATDDGGFVVRAASLPHDGRALVVQGAQALFSEETRSKFSAEDDE